MEPTVYSGIRIAKSEFIRKTFLKGRDLVSGTKNWEKNYEDMLIEEQKNS